MMLQIKIKIKAGLEGIMQAHVGEWYDLRAAEDVSLRKGDYKRIPLGVAMQLPDGYEAHVLPRSSTFERYGILLTNGMGIIDNAYCGDNDLWSFPAYACRDTTIKKNDRICQFRIMPVQPEVLFDNVDRLENADRKGFGSTGV